MSVRELLKENQYDLFCKALNTQGGMNFNATTESTSASTGALIVKGGAGIGRNLNIDGYIFSNQNQVVTPQMFGAVQDGSTDNTVALQNAINYCYTRQKQAILYIPAGKPFSFASPITIGNSTPPASQGFVMFGEYASEYTDSCGSSLIYTGAPETVAITISSGSSYVYVISIRNLGLTSINGAMLINATGLQGPADFTNLTLSGKNPVLPYSLMQCTECALQFKIDNCFFQACTGPLLLLHYCDSVLINNCQFFAAETGIYCDTGENVEISNCYFEWQKFGIEIANDNTHKNMFDINNNLFNVGASYPSGLNTADQRALIIYSSQNANPFHCIGNFSNNTCQVSIGVLIGISPYAVEFRTSNNVNANWTQRWTFLRNQFIGMTTCGIYSNDTRNYITCLNNDCQTYNTPDNSAPSVPVYNAPNGNDIITSQSTSTSIFELSFTGPYGITGNITFNYCKYGNMVHISTAEVSGAITDPSQYFVSNASIPSILIPSNNKIIPIVVINNSLHSTGELDINKTTGILTIRVLGTTGYTTFGSSGNAGFIIDATYII